MGSNQSAVQIKPNETIG